MHPRWNYEPSQCFDVQIFSVMVVFACFSRLPVQIHQLQVTRTWERAQNPKWRPTGLRAARPFPSAVCCHRPSTAKRTSPLWIWASTTQIRSPNGSSGTGFTTPQPPAILDPGQKGGPSSKQASLRRCSVGAISTPTSRQWSSTFSSLVKSWITATGHSASTSVTTPPDRATCQWDSFHRRKLWSSRSTSSTSSTSTITTSSSSSRRLWRPRTPSCSTAGWSTRRWRRAPGTHCVPTTPRRAARRSRPRATCPGCAPSPLKSSASSSPSTAPTTSWCRRCVQITTTTVTPLTSPPGDHMTRRRGEKQRAETSFRVLNGVKWSEWKTETEHFKLEMLTGINTANISLSQDWYRSNEQTHLEVIMRAFREAFIGLQYSYYMHSCLHWKEIVKPNVKVGWLYLCKYCEFHTKTRKTVLLMFPPANLVVYVDSVFPSQSCFLSFPISHW